jgi:hypothetical protein
LPSKRAIKPWSATSGANVPVIRHVGYIGHAIELLKADKRAFFTACSQLNGYTERLALAAPAEIAA